MITSIKFPVVHVSRLDEISDVKFLLPNGCIGAWLCRSVVPAKATTLDIETSTSKKVSHHEIRCSEFSGAVERGRDILAAE